MNAQHLIFFFATAVSFQSAQAIDPGAKDVSQGSPLAECGSFLSNCNNDRDCCTDEKLECENRFCFCQEDWLWNPIDRECERLPDFDDVDDTLVIALSVTGGVILVLAIAAGAFFYTKKKKSRRSAPRRTANAAAAPPPAPYSAPRPHLPNPATLGQFDATQSHYPTSYQQPAMLAPSAPPSYSEAVHDKL